MSTLFTKIINRQLPAFIIAEDQHNIAFLDINPIKKGHTLVVPKKEKQFIYNLEDDLYSSLHMFAKHIACALKKCFSCKTVGMSVIGLEVPHAHVHLVPINSTDELNFNKTKLNLSHSEMSNIANQLIQFIDI